MISKKVLILTIVLFAIAHAFPAPGDLEVFPEGAVLAPVGISDDLDVAEARYGGHGGGGGHYGGGHHGGGHYGGGHGGGGHYGGHHHHGGGGYGHHG